MKIFLCIEIFVLKKKDEEFFFTIFSFSKESCFNRVKIRNFWLQAGQVPEHVDRKNCIMIFEG